MDGLTWFIAAAALAASCAPSGLSLVSSSTADGKTINVFSSQSGAQTVSTEQANGTTTITVGAHAIVVAGDGHVLVDGKERAYGAYRELDVTIADGGQIDVRVAK